MMSQRRSMLNGSSFNSSFVRCCVDDVAGAGAAAAVAFDPFVGADLDGGARDLAGIGLKERTRRLVFGIDRHRVGDFDLVRRPRPGSGRVGGNGPARSGLNQPHTRDLQFAFFVCERRLSIGRRRDEAACGERRHVQEVTAIHGRPPCCAEHPSMPVAEGYCGLVASNIMLN